MSGLSGITLAGVRLGPVVGRGGMGRVYAARHERTGRALAVKIPLARLARDPTFRAAFEREALIMARLNHPALVRVHDVGEVPGRRLPFLVMDWCDGGDYGAFRPRRWSDLRDVLRDALDGLAHLHARDLFHRDLKPTNLLRPERSGLPRARVADFGLAWDRRGGGSGRTGTVGWRAPEQVLATGEIGPWTDLWALGACAHAWLTGRPPRADDAPAAALDPIARVTDPPPGTPSAFPDWLSWLLHVDPDLRPPSAAAAREALRALDPDAPPRPRSVPMPAFVDLGATLAGRREVAVAGRSSELEWIAAQVATTAGPRARITGVALVGPPGVGRHTLARAAAREAHVAFGASVRPLDASVLAAEALPDVRDAPARALLARAASGDADLLTHLTAVRLAVRRLAARGPVVLLALDPGAGPPLLPAALLTEADPLPAAVIAVSTATPAGGAWRPLAVGPLSDDAVRQLLRSVVALEPAVAERIVAQAEGRAGLALGLLRGLLEAGRLAPGRSGLRVADAAPWPVPDVWRERVRRLASDRSEEELRRLAVVGRAGPGFEGTAAAAALGLTDPAPLRRELVRAGLLAPGGTAGPRFGSPTARGGFVHPSVGPLLAALAPPRDKARLARACAPYVSDPIARARTLAEGGDPNAAVRCLADVVADALRRGAFGTVHRAIPVLSAILDDAGRGPCDPDRARTRLWAAQAGLEQGDDPGEALAALAGADQPADVRAEALVSSAALLHGRGRSDEALDTLARAEEVAAGLTNRDLREDLEARVHLRHGEILQDVGRFAEARPAFAQAAARWRALGRPATEGEAWHARATLGLRTRDWAAAAADLAEAERAFAAAGEPWHTALLPNTRAEILRAQGDLAGAEEGYRRSFAAYEHLGSARRFFPLANLGLVLTAQGRHEEARQALQAALDGFHHRRILQFEAAMHASLLPALLALGDGAAFDAHLAAAEGLLATTGYVDADVATSLAAAVEGLAPGPRRARVDGLRRAQEERLRADR